MMQQNDNEPEDSGEDDTIEGAATSHDEGESNLDKSERFPVVGIGASAGGLEALQELFRSMPVDTGMSFVVITHQHPGHESILAELLGRETDMQVHKIENGIHVRPNNVYVLGAAANLRIKKGSLYLEEIAATTVLHMPIDIFFRSLAQDMHERAICIVLSGTGSDGTLGIKEIKAQGGMTLAQEPPSAKYSGMPISARDTGMVDFIEPPSRMPQRMVDYIWGPVLQLKKQVSEEEILPKEDINGILRFLRSRLGHDFSAYKSSTIKRRIQRRMSIHGINNARSYLEYLHDNRPEAQMLFSELLISVTSFFRDPEAFSTLQEKYLINLIKLRPDNQEFRVWVAGCASGEEAYSIAIILDEIRQQLRKPFDIRIFGTDLDDSSIQRARHGVYPASISVDVSRERLDRYFTPDGEDAFAIRKEIRDMLVFAPQNLLSDPPFMKVDLLVCRNVLIYLQSDLQKIILPTFHYAINPGGLLFLGASESVGPHTDLFESLDNRWKVYRKRDVPTELSHLPVRTTRTETVIQEKSISQSILQPQTNRLIERYLLSRFAPVSIIIDTKGTIAYIHGRSGYYLEPEQQQPRNNVFEMAREGLRIPLTAAVHQAIEKGEEVLRINIPVRGNGSQVNVDLTVTPINDPEQIRGLLLITIVPAREVYGAPSQPKIVTDEERATPERIVELERELHYVKETNQTMVEELQSTNEELQSANEELQSTNEELQSSKEEMESLNEELSTVNNELNSKVEALSQARDDMQNLLNSTDLAVIFLDDALRLKRYTVKARSVINLRDTDIGRPISDLTMKLKDNKLLDDCRDVLDTLMRKEKEVVTTDNNWMLMRILPYRTSENVIGGVVVTFVDISQTKQVCS
jgi:two-component system CheB/CheR fusion protein